jgi:hypothetical protein
MAEKKESIARCAEVLGPDDDGLVWLRLVRPGESDTLVRAAAESAQELLRWRDIEGHKSADCAEVIGPDRNGRVRLVLVDDGNKTLITIESDEMRPLLRWRDRSLEDAERGPVQSPSGNIPPPAQDQYG